MSKQKIVLWLLILMVAMVWTSAWAEPAQASAPEVKGILYRAEKDGKTVYLLGSIHIGNQEMHPFGQAIQKAMAQAEIFAFECDTTSRDASIAAHNAMYYKDRTTLQDMIPADCYDKLEEVCKLRGYRPAFFKHSKPWAVMSTLSFDATAVEMGMDNLREAQKFGVETAVMDFVQKNRKQTAYLETTQEQLDAFESFSMPLQVYLLNQTLDVILDPSSVQGLDASMGLWPLWWKEGNAQMFADGYAQGPNNEAEKTLLAEYHEKLVSKRNLLMAERIETMVAQNEADTYFVTVGLLHLVLPQGSVTQLLENKGYQVETLSGQL